MDRAQARVLIADDHPILREALCRLLKNRGHEVVAEAGDGETAVRLALATRPEVAILDIVMPGAMGGLGAARQISRACVGTHVVMISGFADAEQRAAAARAGAKALVAKGAPLDAMIATLDAVRHGRAYGASPETGMTLDAIAGARPQKKTREMKYLTAREGEVLRLVAAGYSSANIAARLEISARTVETHRQSVMTKLGLHSAAALTRFAVMHGLG